MSEILRTNRVAKISLRTVSYAALGCVLGTALLAIATPARAGDDEDPSFEAKILRNVLEGIGLRRDGETQINYGERAPLVIPPGRDLPPPERSDSVIANNPAWPKDPDVQRRKREAAEEKKSTMSTAEQVRHDSGRLSPADLEPGRKTTRTVSRSSTPDGSEGTSWGYGEKMSPKELGYNGSLFGMMFGKGKDKDESVANFTNEPPRTTLTDPPPGYQTPSAVQPYGLAKDKPKAPSTRDYIVSRPEAEQ